MLRQSFIYFLLSIVVVLFAPYAYLGVAYVHFFFNYVDAQLAPAFSSIGFGVLLRKILVLSLLPLVLAGIPALIYKGVKGREMPHFIAFVWVIWIVIVLSNIIVR